MAVPNALDPFDRRSASVASYKVGNGIDCLLVDLTHFLVRHRRDCFFDSYFDDRFRGCGRSTGVSPLRVIVECCRFFVPTRITREAMVASDGIFVRRKLRVIGQEHRPKRKRLAHILVCRYLLRDHERAAIRVFARTHPYMAKEQVMNLMKEYGAQLCYGA